MDSPWRVVALVVAVAAIVGLILFARGPVDHGAQPTHPVAAIEVVG
jgi:hypothetical protein